MIALGHFEKKFLKVVLLEKCLKATPDPEFLSNLYDFDVSIYLH